MPIPPDDPNRPSNQLAALLSRDELDEVPEQDRAAVSRVVYETACRVLDRPDRHKRREALAAVRPPWMRPMVESECHRIWNLRQQRKGARP